MQCWNFIWWSTRRVWLVKTSEFTHIKEGIGSTRQGIMETYTTSFSSKCHQLESRAWLAKQRIQLNKGIMYQGKIHKILDVKNTIGWQPNNGPVSIGNQSNEEGDAKASTHRNVWMIRCLGTKELWFQDEGSEAKALIKRWVSWIDLEAQLVKVWLAENQLISGMTSEPEG